MPESEDVLGGSHCCCLVVDKKVNDPSSRERRGGANIVGSDNAQPTDHPRIMKANEVAMRDEALSELLALLRQACARHDVAWLRSLLEAAPIGYSPSHRIADLMWIKQVRQGLKIVVPASGAA